MSRSIHRQVMLSILVSQTLLAIGLTCAGALYTRRRVQATLDAALQAHATSIAALVRFPEDGSRTLIFDRSLAPQPIDKAQTDIYEVTVDGLGVVARSPNPSDLVQHCVGHSGLSDLRLASAPYRLLCLHNLPMLDREEGQPVYLLNVLYAAPSWQIEREQRAAATYIAGASLLLLGITTLLAMWGLQRGLLPLQQLAEQASRVSAQQWHFQSPRKADLTAELRPLTRAMETMLQRLQASFSQQRESLGNAAHELKTPVSILKSTLQRLVQQQRTTSEYEAGIRQALEDMERLERLLQWMLRLARAEQWAHGTLRRDLGFVNLASTCESAADALSSLAVANRNEIQLLADREISCKADPEDLETIWVNLLENALRYSPRGASVRVKVSKNGNSCATVTVEDDGPGIPPDQREHIFERFHRADSSRTRETGGFGLGLAISKALVEAYGGTIRAESGSGGVGTRMAVELPLQLA
jgi:signal transduction histidine kinase